MRYRVSASAERDLEAIFVYWSRRASVHIADQLIEKITDRFWLLGEHPEAGRAASDIAEGVHCFPAGKYLIYYRKAHRGIDILHIFHGAREQKRAFKKPGRS
jgi:plasmid stabilization system protein ParE